MTRVEYSSDLVRQWRIEAMRAASGHCDDDAPAGWSVARGDPAVLARPFSRLRSRPGWRLRAYRYRSGDDGHSIVFGLPEHIKLPEPDDPTHEPPPPQHALADALGAITGDESAESYLQASVLRRELGDFCARGHGANWRLHHMLGADAWPDPPIDSVSPSQQRPAGVPQMWSWSGAMPHTLAPVVLATGAGIVVTFTTYTALDTEQILRHSDVYSSGSYAATSSVETLATGRPGYRI